MRNGLRISCALLLAAITATACDAPADHTSTEADRGYLIALGSQAIDTRTAIAPRLGTISGASDYTLVKFGGPVTEAQLQALAASATIYTYLPHDTFLVRPKPGVTSGFAAQAAI